jgi:hypothetical protein
MIYLKSIHELSLAFLMYSSMPATTADIQKQNAIYIAPQEIRLAQKAVESIENQGTIVIKGKDKELESYKILRFGRNKENLAVLKKNTLKVMVLDENSVNSFIDISKNGSLDLLVQQITTINGNILCTKRRISTEKETLQQYEENT